MAINEDDHQLLLGECKFTQEPINARIVRALIEDKLPKSGMGRYLPNPNLLIAPYVRHEAVQSSRIEGTKASLSDVLLDEAGSPMPANHIAQPILDIIDHAPQISE